MQWFGKWRRCARPRSASRFSRNVGVAERLEARHFLAASPVITEFVASNESSLADGDGASSDWIEIYNAGDTAFDLLGWHLTDDDANRDKWTFPSVVLAPETFLVVFASGQATETYVDAGGNLHTDFALSAGGEFLGLVDPDGQTVVSSFTPEFPPQLTDISYGRTMARGQVTSSGIGYFLNPTPGAENASAVDNVGPIVTEVAHAPAQPSVGETLTVTAFVEQTGAALGQVNLVYRIMFGQDTTVPMNDQGAGGDATAGDGVFTGVIPATATAGQMVRYYVSAGDVSAKVNRFPQVNDTTGTDQSPQYYGTMVVDTRFNTNLPVFSWFAQNPSAADTRSGARGSVYYAGEFYDNIFIRQRGGATNGGSQKFNFNDDQPFYLNEELGRVLEINMNGPGLDSSYVRQTLGFEAHQVMGVPSNASFLMRMQMNATFDRVGVFIEQTDEDFLERHGYDPQGALYKMVQRSNLGPAFSDTITGLEKKTRLDEGIEDMQALVNALYGQSTTAASRRGWLYDNFNIPELLNYLAARSITLEADDVRKNFYMYRDTNGTGEWSIFPWDKDMNFGIEGDGAPHLHHPFFGDEEHAKANANQWNVLYDVVFETPDLAQMYLRRLRSLADEILQNSRVPLEERYFENRVDEIYATASVELPSAAGAVNSLKNWFSSRRADLFSTYNVSNPRGGANNIVPLEQNGNPALVFGAVDVDGVEDLNEIVYNPISGDQDDEYLTILNPTADAVDISGWTLSGGVNYTFAQGVVIPAGGTLYVSPNVVAFRSRESGPSGGQGLFVQGTGQHLSNAGATIELHAADGQLMDTVTTPEVESSQQKSLRVVELMYHPTDSNTAEIAAGYADAAVFEYVEFQNIGDQPIDLAGASFSVGIDGTIAGAGVMLAPGERALLVSNPDAFAMRYNSNARIVGTFTGKLDNAGERLKLEDAAGETILDFIYDDGWYPSTDGDGYSLEIVDELADTIAWSQAAQWKASAQLGGTPGTGAQTQLPGDANGDGRVDLEDLNAVRNNFGAEGEDVPGDANGDGRVDLEDLNAVRNNFGASSSNVAFTSQSSDLLFGQQSTNNASIDRSSTHLPLPKGRRPHLWMK